MWLVRVALRRPYTFVAVAALISLLGTVTVRHMPTDILPEIDIPVVSLRVFVQVPQSLVAEAQPTQSVQLALNELPGMTFLGQLTRTSGTLDPESRTMRMEERVPNSDGKLLRRP